MCSYQGGTVLQARHSRLFAVAHLSRCNAWNQVHGWYEESMAEAVLTAAVALRHLMHFGIGDAIMHRWRRPHRAKRSVTSGFRWIFQ